MKSSSPCGLSAIVVRPVSEEMYTVIDLVPAGIVNTGDAPPGALYLVSIPRMSPFFPPLGLQGLNGIWPNVTIEQNIKTRLDKTFTIRVFIDIVVGYLRQPLIHMYRERFFGTLSHIAEETGVEFTSDNLVLCEKIMITSPTTNKQIY
jgi:hypothetical protein